MTSTEMRNHTNELRSGAGYCPGTHRLTVEIDSQSLIMGMGPHVMPKIVQAVHSHNRRAKDDDYLAVAFPGFDVRERGFKRLGRTVVIFGDEETLSCLRRGKVLGGLQRRELIERPRNPVSAPTGPGQKGAAFIRSRERDNDSVQRIRQKLERAHERGMTEKARELENRVRLIEKENSGADNGSRKGRRGAAFISLPKMPLAVEPILMETGEEILVSTYGLSLTEAPSALPVMPECAPSQVPGPRRRERAHAA